MAEATTPHQALRSVLDGVQEVFVGGEDVVERLLAAALAGGHVLFEDHPGLGKTLLVKMFAGVLGCESRRIQFTPDLLPADILGTKVWVPADGRFRMEKGPIFSNIVLADEINRAPPKTQAALLEAMEERQVTLEGDTMRLPRPFFVLATQNPLEQEGTYPLPEAQLDRFSLRLSTGYPKDLDDELLILRRRIDWRRDDPSRHVRPRLDPRRFLQLQRLVERRIHVHDHVLEYIARVVRGVRDHDAVEAGPSPRGSLTLLRLGRALALVRGRDYVTPDDVRDLAVEALAHRIVLRVEDELEGVRRERVVDGIVQATPAPIKFRRDA